LRWTFSRLGRERKVAIQGDYAAFNTGLVDHRYEPIYAVFGKTNLIRVGSPGISLVFALQEKIKSGKRWFGFSIIAFSRALFRRSSQHVL